MASGSRGGVLAVTSGLLAMVVLSAWGRGGRARTRSLVVLGGLIVLAGLWVGADVFSGTLGRIVKEAAAPDDSVRLRLWPDAFRLWWRAPLLGTGLGTFGVAFSQVRTLEFPAILSHAESNWVQTLTDTGVLGLGLAVATAGTLGNALMRRSRYDSRPLARNLALGGLVALIGAAVHGLANYGIPVVSNLVYLAVAMGLALAPNEPPVGPQ